MPDLDRKAAEWILSVDGRLNVTAEGFPTEIPYGGKIPEKPFQINLVYLPAPGVAGNPKVTNEGIQSLSGLAGVQVLHLESIGQLSDFSFVSTLPHLTEMYALGTNLDDGSLGSLKALKKLSTLSLASYSSNRITDAGLDNLKGLTDLKNLELSGTGITDAGLEQIARLPKIEYLAIGSYEGKSRITDAGLKHLSKVTSLRRLIIVMTDITEAGLDDLKKLSSLQVLRLEKTNLPESSVVTLKAALPQCDVQFVAK
ncbi:MAG: hypothetical protein IT428_30170 [Planctomycetaceae bacterium]|nr:hypothetical protein [Planctomycetaceae bacterium]